MDSQMKKGVLEMCTLFLISEENVYGYELMKTMKKYFPEVNGSVFYGILKRLKKDGKAETYSGKESNGPQRTYYRITDYGMTHLNISICNWNNLNSVIKQMGIKATN